MTEDAPAVELAISELRRALEVRLAAVDGRLALLQQLDAQAERRIDEQAELLDELAERLATAEREQVTQAQLDSRFRHVLTIIGLLLTAASVVLTAVFTAVGR